MNKLTKEQADWLIEQMHYKGKWLCPKEVGATTDNYITVKDFKTLINQCTEQEFPAFEITGHRVYLNDNEIFIDNGIVRMWYNFDEFKQFTAGCQKIVEWLEEQST